MKISVVIPTCQRNDRLAQCLERFAPGRQSLDGGEYEVIVTDDGSETTAREMISDRFPWVKWVQGPRRGPAANRNNGAQHARGEWLVFVDDDCLPDERLLESYAKEMTSGILALEGSIHPMGEANRDMAECPVNLTGGYFWSANIAVERALFEKIGGFDPAYPMAAHEDQDLFIRLAAHTQVRFVAEARVDHPVRILTVGQVVAQLPIRCRAWAIHAEKHRRELGYDSDSQISRDVARTHFRMASKNILKGRWKTACIHMLWCFRGPFAVAACLRKLRAAPLHGAVQNTLSEAPAPEKVNRRKSQ